MSTYTKEQLKAMRDAGVPIEAETSPGNWSPCYRRGCNQPELHRPQPGFTFSGTMPFQLWSAGVPLECGESGRWLPMKTCPPTNTSLTYRIADSSEPVANTAGRPICMRDEIEELQDEIGSLRKAYHISKKELDVITEQRERLQEDLRITQQAYVKADAERAEVIRHCEDLSDTLNSVRAERDDYARSCSELEKALVKTRMELTDARKERDGERARVSEFIADSSKLNSFRAALKNLLNS
jgi:hypothetical protein